MAGYSKVLVGATFRVRPQTKIERDGSVVRVELGYGADGKEILEMATALERTARDLRSGLEELRGLRRYPLGERVYPLGERVSEEKE